MGRPLNKKYFGQTNIAITGEGVGGESIASVTIGTPVSATFTSASATFTAPQIPGGETATGTVTLDGDGDIAGITITNSGSGYTSLPTITVSGAGNVDVTLTSGSDTVTIALTSGASARQNSITITAWVPASGAAGYISGTGGSSAVTGDILRQVGSKKYVVQTAQGIGRVTLVADTIAAGQATIIATDANGNTYYVTKLTAHKATLTRLVDDGGDSDWVFATGAVAQWSFNAASGTIVQIANR